ncbi:MAG: hypothetical protein V1494_04390 [Candidatus Diapherotrites archaeon]
MDSNTANLAFGALIVVGVLAVALFASGAFNGNSKVQYSAANYQQAVAVQNPNDVCATPAGYTDEQWSTHMSHHPDQYAQCFN